MEFELDTQLATDTVRIRNLKLSEVRLMNCNTIPWLVLVPRKVGMREIIDLDEVDREQLMREIFAASLVLKQQFSPDKINIGALGNVVSQLHVHVIARYRNDAAWPKPVWGNVGMQPYEAVALEGRIDLFRAHWPADPL